MALEFSRQIFENTETSNFMKIYPVRACGQTDRRTGMTKLIAAFRNFANAPKKRAGDNSEIEILSRVDWCTGTNFPEQFDGSMCRLVVLPSRDAIRTRLALYISNRVV
jgi:hypothetical protein